jgi:hypothetical protein
MTSILHKLAAAFFAVLLSSLPAWAQVYSSWRLTEIRQEMLPPGGIQSNLVRIDSIQADAMGGFVRMTSLSDNSAAECVGAMQRHQFIWTFSRDITLVSGNVGDTVFSAYPRIEGDQGSRCVDLNPYMTGFSASGRIGSEVILGDLGGEPRWYFNEVPGFLHNSPAPDFYINRSDNPRAGFEVTIPIPRAGVSGGLWLYVEYLYWAEGAVSVDRPTDDLPHGCAVLQNYPNPFNPSTTIRYGLPHKSQVSLMVYNTLGQEVATLAQGEQETGYHDVRFDASGLSSGVYFYRLQAGTYVETRKLLLIR